MKELIGKKITGISISEDHETLAFETDKGTIVYTALGGCCSESWFADITGVCELLRGGAVKTVETIDMDGYNVDDGRCRQECDEAYGLKLVTDRGYTDIVFRNSSNGYYGGWLDDGTWREPPDGMTAIVDDWHA